jgi:general secretion pathway protein J
MVGQHTRLGTTRQQSAWVDEAGFTLIEALVAMVLTGFIIAALAGITTQWIPNWDHGLKRVQATEQVTLGLERMIADLAAAEFIPANRKSSIPVFSGSAYSVTFVRTALAPNAGPGLEIVQIAERLDGPSPKLIRTEAPFIPVADAATDPFQSKFGDPVVLINAPYSISFSYAGPDREWRTEWQDLPVLPTAIKATLRDAATRRTVSLSTATLVHAEIPARCVSAKSLADCFASAQKSPGGGGTQLGGPGQ